MLKHNYQAHNSECNVVISCHELQMNDEILCTEAMLFTITQISCYSSAGAEVKGRSGPTRWGEKK